MKRKIKKNFIIVIVFLAGAVATLAYLYKQEKINDVSATPSQIWTENKPLISPETPTDVGLDIFVKIAKKFKPTVVNIHTTQTVKSVSPFGQFGGGGGGGGMEDDFFRRFFDDFFGGMPNLPKDYKQKNLGSGFIISEDGYIITNHHVIDKAEEIKVKLSNSDKNSFNAKLIGSDKWTDVAVLKIDPKGKKLPVAPLGNSDVIEVGEWVAAIGHPFGYGHTVSHGIISAKERILGENGASHPFNDYIQTDASINLGNSGGPLISAKGEVIGINVATDVRAQGIIGFAIPINIAKDLIPQLIKLGHAVRGFIGIVYEDLTEELAEYLKLDKSQKGVVISEVIKGNPADLAGLKVYDVIIEFNGAPISSGRDLLRQVGKTPVGKSSQIKVLREGDTKTFELKPIERKDESIDESEAKEKEPKKGKPELGLEVEDLDHYPGLRDKLKVSEGVVITNVAKDSPAQKAGLEKGDVIVEINRQKISDLSDYRKVISGFQKGKSYLFRVKDRRRSGTSALVIIKVE